MGVRIQQILDQQNHPYVLDGPNVARGNLNIKCPWCGDADPSEHLGINLTTGAWGCWRNAAHRGRTFYRLFHRLFGWSHQQTADVVGDVELGALFDPHALEHAVDALRTATVDTGPTGQPTTWPASVEPLTKTDWPGSLFHSYLVRRGFAPETTVELAEEYGLHFGWGGEWDRRILIPVFADGKVWGWTGRTINTRVGLRYKTTAPNGVLTDCVWRQHELQDGAVLVVVEGPFDALKLDWFGWAVGVRATCIFGSRCSEGQAARLRERTHGLVVALDADNIHGTLRATGVLADCNPHWEVLTMGKDFGELSADEIFQWCVNLRRRLS